MRMLCFALAGNALGLLIVPLPTSFAVLVPVIALLFAVGSPIGPLADGLIARLAARYDLAFGQMRLWGSLSWAIVAAVGGALWQALGFSLMFPVAALLFLLMVPVARLLQEDAPSQHEGRLPLRTVLADRRLRVLLVASLVLGLGMSMVATFGGIYLDRVGGGQFLVGLFSCVTALSELPVMHFSERFVGRIGGSRTLLLAYIFTALSYVGMALTAQPLLLLGMGVLQGLGFGLFLPVTVRLVANWSPPEWTATSQGLLTGVLWGVAPLAAGPLGGALYDTSGPAVVFIACGAAVLGASLVLILGLRQSHIRTGETAQQV